MTPGDIPEVFSEEEMLKPSLQEQVKISWVKPIAGHQNRSKGHARVQKNGLEELQANSFRVVYGSGVGEEVIKKTGHVL